MMSSRLNEPHWCVWRQPCRNGGWAQLIGSRNEAKCAWKRVRIRGNKTETARVRVKEPDLSRPQLAGTDLLHRILTNQRRGARVRHTQREKERERACVRVWVLGWQKTFIYTVRKIYTHEKKNPANFQHLAGPTLVSFPLFFRSCAPLLSSPHLPSSPLTFSRSARFSSTYRCQSLRSSLQL